MPWSLYGGQRTSSGGGLSLLPCLMEGLWCLLLCVPGQLANELLGSLLSSLPISQWEPRDNREVHCLADFWGCVLKL